MHSTVPTMTATSQHQSAKQSSGVSTTTTTTTGYAFLSAPPKPKNRPQPITTRCSPPRSLPRSIPRRRSSISSPAFQTTFVVPVSTPTSDAPKTPHLTNYGYTAAFATLPRRGSVSHVQEVQCHQARRAPVSPKRLSPRSAPSSPKRGQSTGSPKKRHHRSPSSPFAPPSPTRTRARAESTTRVPFPIPPTPSLPSLPRTPKLSKIRSLTNLRSRSSSSAPAPRATAPRPTMDIHTPTTPKVSSKRTKRSATPARGSAAYAKYRPMPFIQQMQMIQFLEGGSLDSHIRRHHVHAGQGTAHTGFATNGNEDVAHGYSFTDERGMVWFDEEEEWEFTCLLPRTRPQRRRGGFKRFLGKRRDEESGDEWEDFVQEEEEDLEEDMDPEARDDALRTREDDLASFGGALEGTWMRGHPGQSVLKLPETKMERKRREHKKVGGIGSSAPATLPARATATTRAPREQISALKDEFLATAFTPSTTRPSESSSQRPRAASPFRMFTRATTSMDDNATTRPFFHRHKNPSVGSQSFASMGGSLRGGDVLDATETVSVPPSPTVQWATKEDATLTHVSNATCAAETRRRIPSPPPNPESWVRCVSPPPAAARRLGIEPSTAVSLQPLAAEESMKKKQVLKGVRGFKSTRGN